MKKIIFIMLFLSSISLDAQIRKVSRVELGYNDTPIGRSLQLELQHQYKNLQFNYGIRYHLYERPTYNKGLVFARTMYPKNLIQSFGPTLGVFLMIPTEKLVASPFIGYHTQLGVMTRQIQFTDQIGAGTWTEFEADSPLYRWENQIVIGSYFQISKQLSLKLFGGLGVAGIYNIDRRYTQYAFTGRKTYEFGYEFGIGLSYDLRKKKT